MSKCLGLACIIIAVCTSFFVIFTERQKSSISYDKPELRQIIEGRGAHEFLMTHDPSTQSIPKERLMSAKTYTEQLLRQKAAIPNVNWEERGPNNVSGRTRALLVDAGDPTGNTVFAGGVGGGIWRTEDDGNTWMQVDDFLDNMAVNSIIQDPNNSDVIYFGTGEGYGNSDAIRGMGIWKSTDGGLTFNQLSFTNNNSDFFYVNSLAAIDIGSSTVLLAACSNLSGVHRSTDGGNTWTEVLGGSAMDLTIASNGDAYAGMDLSGIYKSTDNGLNWTEVYDGNNEGRIELAAAPSNSQVVYALIEGLNSVLPRIRKTVNGGTDWTLVSNPVWFDQNCGSPNADWTRGQDWYDLIAAVDPNDEDRVFVGAVDLFVTDDGGINWTQITSWAGACGRDYLHADQHALVFVGNNSSELWSGNDGGVSKSYNATQAIPNFDFKGVGYNVTQFYACDIHPSEGEEYFLAGSQDNGTQRFISAGLNWTTSATGGDGGFCHIDQLTPNVQITSFTRNNYNISIDGGNSYFAGPRQNTGLFINPTDYDDEAKKLYGSWSTGIYFRWENPSTGGASYSTINVQQITGSCTHVRTSPNVSNRVYFGTSSGRVVRVNNAHNGASGSSKNGSVIFDVGVGSVSCVEIEVGNEDHMIITLSNYGVVSIYESTNATSADPNWTNIEGNLPDIPVRWALLNPNDNDQLMLATELGVWSTDDIYGSNTDWEPTNANLANTRVDMIKLRSSDNIAIAATHGRGLFSSIAFNEKIFFSKSAPVTAKAGDVIQYHINIFNNQAGPITNVSVTDVLDSDLIYQEGSLTCGTFNAGVINITEANIAAGGVRDCYFETEANINEFSILEFADDIEAGRGNWTINNIQGLATWSITALQSNSPSQSWYTPNTGTQNNTQYLTLDEMTLPSNAFLSFWHNYNTEIGWDGGLIEISTNGGTDWIDLGSFICLNPYNGVLGAGSNSNIGGKQAFTGSSEGFIQTIVDLSSFGMVNAQIRFVFGEDNNTNEEGWFIDDVELYNGHVIENIACLTTDQGDMLCDTVKTFIFECETNCWACYDGKQNGYETGIDCGGHECEPCDCTDTQEELLYDNTTIPDATSELIKTSISTINTVTIDNGSTVILKAGNRFQLEPGFLINRGAALEMSIEDCDLPTSFQQGGIKK